MLTNFLNRIKENISWKDLVIIILVLYLLYKVSVVEKMADTTDNSIRETIKDVYQVDVQAIKNLGDVAKTLLNPEKTDLILPYNVKIEGKLDTTGDIKSTGANIALVDEEGNDRFRIHETQGNSYIDSKGSLSFRNSDNVSVRTNIQANDISATNVNATNVNATNVNATTKVSSVNLSVNDIEATTVNASGKVSAGDVIAKNAVSAGNGAISMNPNTYGRPGIYAPGGLAMGDSLYVNGTIISGNVIEANELKSKGKIYIKDKWFEWRDSTTNDSCFQYSGMSSGGVHNNC